MYLKNTILLFIVIVIIIALFSLKIHRLKGGEFLLYHSKVDKKFTPSISQIELADSIEPSVRTRDNDNLQIFDYIISKCIQRLNSISSFSWKDEHVYWSKADEPHLVSDAHLDLIGMMLSKQVSKAIAVCEWHGDIYRAENNAIVTIYKDGKLSLSKAIEQKYLTSDFLCFFGYTPDEDKEIAIVNSLIEKTKTKYSLHSVWKEYHKKDIDYESFKNDKQYSTYGLDSILTKGDFYRTTRIRNIARATTPIPITNETSLCKYDYLIAILNRYRMLKALKKTNTNTPEVKIYIEYSYGTGRRANELFAIVHKHTNIILNQIIEEQQSNEVKKESDVCIYCYRFQLESKEGIKKELLNLDTIDRDTMVTYTLDGRTVIIDVFDECKYETVEIPKTSSEFSYDEQLFLLIDGYNYNVQIEHSENGSKHKSNFVEFLARNIINTIPFVDVIELFKNRTRYLDEHNHFKWEFNEDGAQLENSVIYKAFGEHKDKLFIKKSK